MASTSTPSATRERLLEAAGQVFAEQGFAKATVRAICAAAGANVAAVNYHFGDKETLYREVFQHAFRELHRHAPAVPVDTTWRGRLEAYVGALLERLLSAGESWHGRLMARELAQPGPALAGVVDVFLRPQMALLDELIAEARPDLEPRQRELHALGLMGKCVFYRHSRPILDQLYGADRFQRDELPALRRYLIESFLRELELPLTPDDSSIKRRSGADEASS